MLQVGQPALQGWASADSGNGACSLHDRLLLLFRRVIGRPCGLVAICLAPLNVTGQSVKVRERGVLMNPVPKQRTLQFATISMRYSNPNNFFFGLELLRRNWMRCESTALRPEAGSHDSRNVSNHLLDLKRVFWKRFTQVLLRTAPRKDFSIFARWTPAGIAGFAFVTDAEIERDKRAPGPVEQSRGKAGCWAIARSSQLLAGVISTRSVDWRRNSSSINVSLTVFLAEFGVGRRRPTLGRSSNDAAPCPR